MSSRKVSLARKLKRKKIKSVGASKMESREGGHLQRGAMSIKRIHGNWKCH